MRYHSLLTLALFTGVSAMAGSSAFAAESTALPEEVIDAVQDQHPDATVQVESTTTVEDNAEKTTQTKTKTTVTPVSHKGMAQGPAAASTLTDEDFPPRTDEASKLVYVSGGVGEDEIAYFKALKGDYTLKLLMGDTLGHLVGGASLAIADASGKTIATLPEVGPYLLVKLPEGKYKLTATFNSIDVVRNVTIKPAKLTAVDVRFINHSLQE